jgi:hypothetical protein
MGGVNMEFIPKVNAKTPAELTIADDWCIKLPDGYVYSTFQNEEDHKLLTIRTLDNSEVWEVKRHEKDIPKYDNLLDNEARNEIIRKKIICEGGLDGSKKFEFVLRQESDICIYCQLIEGDGEGEFYDYVHYELQVVTRKAIYEFVIEFKFASMQDDFQDRINRIANSICLKEEGKAPDYTRKFMTLNKKLPITNPRNPEILGACSQWIKVQKTMAKLDTNMCAMTKYSLLAVKNIHTSTFTLSEKAWHMSENFHVHDYLNGSYDRAMEIQHCVMYDIEPIHKFRTFAWLVAEYCQQKGSSPDRLDKNVVLALGQLAGSRVASYNEDYYSAICGYPDNHTVYVPNGEKSSYKDELPDTIKYASDDTQWYIGDLNRLREELTELYPCMIKITEYLQDTRKNDNLQLCGDHSDILYAWCTLAIASNYAFAIVSCESCESNEQYDRPTYQEFIECDLMPDFQDYEECADRVYINESNHRLMLGVNTFSLAISKDIECFPETDDEYATLNGFCKDSEGNGIELTVRKLDPIEETLREFLKQNVENSSGTGYYMMLHEEDNVEVGIFMQISAMFLNMNCNICLIIRIDGIAYIFQAQYGCKGFALGTILTKSIQELSSIFDDILITHSGRHIHCEVDNNVLKKIVDSAFGIDKEQESKKGEHCTVDTPAIVRDDWVITVPAGYMYSTDTELVGHRPIVLGLDDGTLNFASPFDSTINFSVIIPIALKDEPMPDLPLSNPQMAMYNMMAQIWSSNCIRKNDNIAVYGSVGNIEPNEDGGTLCISRGGIVTRHSVYTFQLFDSQATSQSEAEATMLRLLKSIRTKKEFEHDNKV